MLPISPKSSCSQLGQIHFLTNSVRVIGMLLRPVSPMTKTTTSTVVWLARRCCRCPRPRLPDSWLCWFLELYARCWCIHSFACKQRWTEQRICSWKKNGIHLQYSVSFSSISELLQKELAQSFSSSCPVGPSNTLRAFLCSFTSTPFFRTWFMSLSIIISKHKRLVHDQRN